MRVTIAIFTAAVVLLVLAGCPPTPGPVPPPTPDGSDAALAADTPTPTPPGQDDCQLGCAALAAVHCDLGDGGADCAAFLRVLNDTGREPNPSSHRPLRCADVRAIQTQADAQRLGFACRP